MLISPVSPFISVCEVTQVNTVTCMCMRQLGCRQQVWTVLSFFAALVLIDGLDPFSVLPPWSRSKDIDSYRPECFIETHDARRLELLRSCQENDVRPSAASKAVHISSTQYKSRLRSM